MLVKLLIYIIQKRIEKNQRELDRLAKISHENVGHITKSINLAERNTTLKITIMVLETEFGL